MSKNERRNFLRNSLLGIPALGLLSAKKPKNSLPVNSKRRNRIGVSTYSFWRFNGPKEETPIEYCIDQAAAMGFDGVELLLVQMESVIPSAPGVIRLHQIPSQQPGQYNIRWEFLLLDH